LSDRLNAHLHYLQLSSERPAALADFYGSVMHMKVQARGADRLCRSVQRRLLITRGRDRGLVAAGYAVPGVEDLDALTQRLRHHAVTLEKAESELFLPGALSVRDPDGNRIIFGIAAMDDDTPDALPARLQHVVVASRNAARLLPFYQDVLGFTLSDRVEDETGALRAVFLRSDREHHSFACFQASEDRLDHHCYETADWNLIRDWADRLATLDIPLKWGPGRHGPGNNLFLFFHDCDGNWLEISAELEVVAPDRPVTVWPHAQRTLNRWGDGLLRS